MPLLSRGEFRGSFRAALAGPPPSLTGSCPIIESVSLLMEVDLHLVMKISPPGPRPLA